MKIVFTPDWFLQGDILIEIISFAILVLFFYFCRKNYKLSGKKSILYLGVGFLLIALAEISTIITKFVLYYDTTFVQEIGRMIVTYNVTHSVDIFYYIGFFFHKIFTLLGFFIIYKIPMKKGSSRDLILTLYFILVAALFSQGFYYLFHLTATGLLILIISNYYSIYSKNKSENTFLLITAFSGLALSQIIAVLSPLNVLYVISQGLQLVSYLILLILIIRITKYGREKKSN